MPLCILKLNSNLGKVKLTKTEITATTGATGNISLGDCEPIRITCPGYIGLIFWSSKAWYAKILNPDLSVVANTSVTYTLSTITTLS